MRKWAIIDQCQRCPFGEGDRGLAERTGLQVDCWCSTRIGRHGRLWLRDGAEQERAEPEAERANQSRSEPAGGAPFTLEVVLHHCCYPCHHQHRSTPEKNEHQSKHKK